jgi:hypothetical protein
MVWLRYELWEYRDGPCYRLASKAETDRLAAADPEGHLRNVFYAPSPAAAEAQYCALRGIGPYIVNPADSEEPFAMAQLESQLADFPEDERLARQPALPQATGQLARAPAPVLAAQMTDAHHRDGAMEPAVEPQEHAAHHEEHGVHVEPVEVAPQLAAESMLEPAETHSPEPALHGAEPLEVTPETASAAIDVLGPITVAPIGPQFRVGKRRKPNAFLGFLRLLLRLLMLVFILGAVALGVGIATGTLDARTVLAHAQALPTQIRDHSIVQSLLP